MINLEGIKNIIFDFGDVICDIDFKRTVDAFSQLSENTLAISVENYIHHPIFGGLEKGDISTEQFRVEIRSLLKTKASDAAIDDAWAQVIINSDQERIDMLKKLNEDYRIFLLSNTNAIHVTTAFERINKSFDVDFRSLFEEVYFSHQLGMAKPAANIYNYVLEDAKIEACETLFIDDNKANIEGAQQLGFKTYHLKPREEKVIDLF
ncbi:MAG: HAD family phosphatase [Bacteroidales bacterium]|jgi:HAD superfamily hydrolase (TIGR01509 family)|nr:HAD family phosphatase [Bacteroidales bacterium]